MDTVPNPSPAESVPPDADPDLGQTLDPPPPISAWRRLGAAFHPQGRGGQVLIALLFVLLGMGLVVQVRSTNADSLENVREEDLIRILDNLGERQDRLRDQAQSLRTTRSELTSGSDQASTALLEAERQARMLGILSGTEPATGPGVTVSVANSQAVSAAQVLGMIQEFRDAGAEVMDINGHRIVVSTAFTEGKSGIEVDGVALDQPYVVTAIGDPGTLAAALRIPGGVIDTLRRAGAEPTIEQSDQLTITSLHVPVEPQYARRTKD